MWSVQQIKGTVKQKGTAWETHKDSLLQVWNGPILQMFLISGKKSHRQSNKLGQCADQRKNNVYVHDCKVNVNPTENATAPVKLFNYANGNKRCFLCLFTSSKQRTSYMICRASNCATGLPEAETLASHGCNKNVCKRDPSSCVL